MAEPVVLVWMLVEQEGKVLLGRRKADQPPFAGLWTLPGDVMREDESALETLDRAARDELGAPLTAEEFADTVYASEAGIDYAANVFRVSLGGHARFRESGPFAEMIWAPRVDLKDVALYPMPGELRSVLAEGGEVAEGKS